MKKKNSDMATFGVRHLVHRYEEREKSVRHLVQGSGERERERRASDIWCTALGRGETV